jgi:ABC-2 type transport system permease protein
VVAHLLRLKLTLLRNGLRRSPWQLVGMVVGALYGLGLVLVAAGGLIALRFVPAEQAAVAVTLAGSATVVGWWVVPLVASGVDSTLDPRRFATYAVPRGQLLVGLALAGVVGVPGAATAVLALGTAVSWSRGPATTVAALLGAVLGVATCVVGARAWTTLLARLVTSRRFREGAGLVVAIPLLLVGPLLSGLAEVLVDGVDALPGLAAALSWTPLGAPWAIPGDVAGGAWAAAVARTGLAAATFAGLAVVWSWSLSRTLESPPTSGGGAARTRGRGLLGLLPATPTGAVAARCLVYWVRDPRYAASLVIVPLLPVLFFFMTPDGRGLLMLSVAPVTAFLMGWAISADVAYDGTAFWLQVSSAVSGVADRAGRVLAAGIVAVPITVALAVGSVWWTGRWGDLLAVLGLSLGVLLTAFGLSSAVSARFLYPVPQPGQSAFATPSGSVGVNLLTQLLGWTVLLVLVLPETVLAALAVARGSQVLGAATLVVGLVLGAVLLVGGVRLGARWFDRRSPELMQQVAAMA